MSTTRDKSGALRWGLIVAVLLFILTVLEYIVAVRLPGILLLMLIAVLKAALIIKEFMHVGLVFGGEGEGH